MTQQYIKTQFTDGEGQLSSVTFPLKPTLAADLTTTESGLAAFVAGALSDVVLGIVTGHTVVWRDNQLADRRLPALNPDARRESKAVVILEDADFDQYQISIGAPDLSKQNTSYPGYFYRRAPDGTSDPDNHPDWSALAVLLNTWAKGPLDVALTVKEIVYAGANV